MSQGVDIRLRSTPGASPLLQVARIEGHGCVLHGCATLKRLVMDKRYVGSLEQLFLSSLECLGDQ